MGKAFRDLNEYGQAIKCFDMVVKTDPNDDAVWYNKGFVLYKQNKFYEAIECFNESFKIDPCDDYVWYNISFSFYALKKDEDALKLFDEAFKINPSNKFILERMGKEFKKLQQLSKLNKKASKNKTGMPIELPNLNIRKSIIEDSLHTTQLESDDIIDKLAEATTGWSSRLLIQYFDTVKNQSTGYFDRYISDKVLIDNFERINMPLSDIDQRVELYKYFLQNSTDSILSEPLESDRLDLLCVGLAQYSNVFSPRMIENVVGDAITQLKNEGKKGVKQFVACLGKSVHNMLNNHNSKKHSKKKNPVSINNNSKFFARSSNIKSHEICYAQKIIKMS